MAQSLHLKGTRCLWLKSRWRFAFRFLKQSGHSFPARVPAVYSCTAPQSGHAAVRIAPGRTPAGSPLVILAIFLLCAKGAVQN